MHAPSRNLLSSTIGKLSALTLTFAAQQTIPSSAEADQTTTITHKKVMECVGSNFVGAYSIYNKDLIGTETSNKTDLSITTTEIGEINGTNGLSPNQYVARTYRNYVYGYTEEGWYMYDENNTKIEGAKAGVDQFTFPSFKFGIDDVFFIENITFDLDRLLIIGPKKIEVYTPFKADGKTKTEFITGDPVISTFILIPTASILSAKVVNGMIYALEDNGGKKQLSTYKVQGDIVSKVGVSVPVSDDMETWNQAKKVVVVLGDGKSKTTYLALRDNNADSLMLMDTSDLTKTKNLPGVKDMVTVDPEGRYQIRSLSSGKTIVMDGVTGISKDILPQAVYPLNGYVAWLPAYQKPTIQIVDKQKDTVYLIDITNGTVVSSTPLNLFTGDYKTAFGTGGGDCVNNPNVTGTVTVTGTPADAGDASVVEGANEGASEGATEGVVEVAETMEKDMDAGTTEGVDGGSTDTVAEVIVADGGAEVAAEITAETDGGNDTIETWLDGKGDMSEIFSDIIPDTAETTVSTEVDGEVLSPDTQQADNADTTNDTATSGDVVNNAQDISIDAGSHETSRKPPVIAPAPKDTGCNATGTGNGNNGLTPLAIALGVGAAVGLARRREAVHLDSGIDNV